MWVPAEASPGAGVTGNRTVWVLGTKQGSFVTQYQVILCNTVSSILKTAISSAQEHASYVLPTYPFACETEWSGSANIRK